MADREPPWWRKKPFRQKQQQQQQQHQQQQHQQQQKHCKTTEFILPSGLYHLALVSAFNGMSHK